MKKILLTTTAMAAGVLISNTAVAESYITHSTRYMQQNDMMGPSSFKFDLNGYANWYMGYADNQIENTNDFDILTSAAAHFNFTTALKNGVEIAAKARIDSYAEDEVYMSIRSKYGEFLAGKHDNVNKRLSLRAIDVGALGIQDSEFNRVVITPMETFESLYMSQAAGSGIPPEQVQQAFLIVGIIPSQGDASYFTFDEDQTKLSYITPEYKGFQFGMTYAPRSTKDIEFDDGGDILTFNQENLIATARYATKIDKIDVAVSGGYQSTSFFGSFTEEFELPNIKLWNIGANIAYKNINLSSAYKENTTGEFDLSVWDISLAYETGPYAMSISYLKTEINRFYDGSTLLVSGKYNIEPGVDVFATIGKGDYEITDETSSGPDEPPTKNDGWAVVFGTMLSF